MSTILESPLATKASPPPAPQVRSDLQHVQIELIVPSAVNMRQHRSQEKDAELLESVRGSKVWQAGLLRPVKATVEHVRRLEAFSSPTMGLAKLKATFGPGDLIFELVAGRRRWEASLKAGKLTYPATVQEMDDAQALELQIIENDDREDLDPIDRALGVRTLVEHFCRIEKAGKRGNAEAIKLVAARLKRKERTVYNLLALGNLSAEGQKLLREGALSQSHAYEIAPRSAAEQEKILDWVQDQCDYDTPPSVRELKDYIREECDHYLDSAPFPTGDASLLPTAGGCDVCMKNTAVNPNLMDLEQGKKAKRAACTDGECYKQKVQNNLVRIEKQTEQEAGKGQVLRLSEEYPTPKGAVEHGKWKEVKAGSCNHTFIAVVVDGEKPGRKLYACAATNLCKQHWGPGSHSAIAGLSYSRTVSRPRSDEEKRRMLQKQRNKKLDQAFRTALTAELAKKVTDLKIDDLREVALCMAHLTDRRFRNPIFSAMGWKTSDGFYGPPIPTAKIEQLKPVEAALFLSLMTFASKVLPGLEDYWPDTKVPVTFFAKRHKLDLAKIHAAAAAPLQAKWKEIDARKAKARAAEKLKTKSAKKKAVA